MRAAKGLMITTGFDNDYWWLTSSLQYMGTLIRLCPEVVLNRHLVVTAIDGGTPWLTDLQTQSGWHVRNGMAYGPPIGDVRELFYQRDGPDEPGMDDWYVFDRAPGDLGEILQGNPFLPENSPQPGRLLIFVQWISFSISLTDAAHSVVRDMFWRQMEWIQPDVYISDGQDNLTVVCKSRSLHGLVRQRLSAE